MAGRGGARPYIGRARLPPVERAKLKPLLHGGVQFHYEHRRHNDYASSTRSLQVSQHGDVDLDFGGSGSIGSPALSVKSCDNLFSRRWPSCAPAGLWRPSTRSEEAICRRDSLQRQTGSAAASPKAKHANSVGNVAQQFSGAKARLAALLRKLSPRGLRRSRSQPSTASDVPTPCPWLLVEFSASDIGDDSSGGGVGWGIAGSRDSGGSDRSFDAAAEEACRRKEEHLRKVQHVQELARREQHLQSQREEAQKELRQKQQKPFDIKPVVVVTTSQPYPQVVIPKIRVASPGSSTGRSIVSSSGAVSPSCASPGRHSQSPSKPSLKPKPVATRG